VIDRERLAASLGELDGGTRALLDLSLRRAIPDDQVAKALGVDAASIPPRRARGIAELADRMEVPGPSELAALLIAIPDLPDDAWDVPTVVVPITEFLFVPVLLALSVLVTVTAPIIVVVVTIIVTAHRPVAAVDSAGIDATIIDATVVDATVVAVGRSTVDASCPAAVRPTTVVDAACSSASSAVRAGTAVHAALVVDASASVRAVHAISTRTRRGIRVDAAMVRAHACVATQQRRTISADQHIRTPRSLRLHPWRRGQTDRDRQSGNTKMLHTAPCFIV